LSNFSSSHFSIFFALVEEEVVEERRRKRKRKWTPFLDFFRNHDILASNSPLHIFFSVEGTKPKNVRI
jgi:hypothetical protein